MVILIVLLILYFLVPAIFYFYTISECKKYNRKVTWCENAIKIKKPKLVSTPLLIIGLISVTISVNVLRILDLESNLGIITLLVCNMLFYLFWVSSIYKFTGNPHLIFGLFYIVTLALLVANILFINPKTTALIIFGVAVTLNLLMGLNIFTSKKTQTLHEEFQAVFLTLFHLVAILVAT